MLQGSSLSTTAVSMFSALKKTLGIFTTNHSRKCTEAPLFSGSAYFSNRVPKYFSEKWAAHGGEISSGTIWDVRARYFFATDPSEPWVTNLFSKSVMVIHAGWIVHCIDEAFQVPISKYILDDKFVSEPPYKLTDNVAPPIYVPLSEPEGLTDTESGESGPTPIQTSDTPSTPTSIPRKRKREQAYFDSPSGSLVFSGFDKDGMPRRPRKQRRLRFNPSFSPLGGTFGREAMRRTGLDWFRDCHDASTVDDEFSEGHSQEGAAGALHGPSHMTTVHSPDTLEKSRASEEPSATYPPLLVDEHPSKPSHVSSPAISIDKRQKMPPVRTIDFTNLPPPTRRWRFPEADGTKSGDKSAILSVSKVTEHKVKTPKKISFADHARVCVYMVSPRRSDAKDSAGADSARQCLSQGPENGPEVDGQTRLSSDEVQGSDNSTAAAEAFKDLAPRIDSPIINDPTRLLDGNQFENDTLTLTMEEVQAMRRRLLESAEMNGANNGQLATLFELGRTFRGMAFRHVW